MDRLDQRQPVLREHHHAAGQSRPDLVFLRGANLCTISGIKDVDPENINAGVTTYPLYRTFTAGFKFTF